MSVCSQKQISVRIHEDTYRNRASAEKYLRCCFMLPIENLDFRGSALRRIDPAKRDMQLGDLLVEFFDKLFQVLANCTGIDVVVMVHVE